MDSKRISPSKTLVWVTIGQTQHPAYLLDTKEDGLLVQWSSTLGKEWVDPATVQRELSTRRRQRKSFDTPLKKKRRRTSVETADTNTTEQESMDAPVELALDQERSTNHAAAGIVRKSVEQPTHLHSSAQKAITRKPPRVSSTPGRVAGTTESSCETVDDGPDRESHTAELRLGEPSDDPNHDDRIPCNESTNKPVSLEPCLVERATATKDSCPEPSTNDTDDAEAIARSRNTELRQEAGDADDEPLKDTDEAVALVAAAESEEANEHVTAQYTCLSSAYLQNLAEICHLIMNDRRWRVDGSMKPLFRWEDGEDLSAVISLSRLFRTHPPAASPWKCTCLLCGSKPSATSMSDEQSVKGDAAPPTEDLVDDEETRSLYLYCRLFYRKGPWFRLDDVYQRYYAPKRRQSTPPIDTEKAHSDKKDKTPTAKENFFQNNGRLYSEQSVKKSTTTIDRDLLQEHLICLANLLDDLRRLDRVGLLRSFSGEEECGRTVGMSLLREDERGDVIKMLGGEKKKKGKASSDKTTGEKENLVWKQMSQQRTLFHHQGGAGEKRRLLPVKKHVDRVILQKVAKSIVEACSSTEHVPAPIMRANVQDVITAFNKMQETGPVACLCFRLREAPTHVLRRCARLFLCATKGPGDMRGEDAWRSLLDVVATPPLSKMIPPPSLSTWNQVQYPGLTHRFGMSSSCFQNAFVFLPSDQELPGDGERQRRCEHVFDDQRAFRAWEMTVELRANVDYLTLLSDTLRSEARRQERGKESLIRRGNTGDDSVDFMQILTAEGRQTITSVLLYGTDETVENGGMPSISEGMQGLEQESEKVLCGIADLALHVLCVRNRTISSEELHAVSNRPWLRHMRWDGCLAYVLWDIIPLLERRGLYRMAVMALEVLLFGFVRTDEESPATQKPLPDYDKSTMLAPLLLSRRARGKALDRLVIDYTHLERQEIKAQVALVEAGVDESVSTQKAEKSAPAHNQARILRFCEHILTTVAHRSAIGFSAIRGVARRLKRPLFESLRNIFCLEARELGLRLSDGHSSPDSKSTTKQYEDWTPRTDKAVANAIGGNEGTAGARCAFVGFEDDGLAETSSLNVEQLAMEFYNSGRLPEDGTGAVKGGWVGWHDEGGHVRALFRVLCSAPVLGMDWGCAYAILQQSEDEHSTIHLSPYQNAPFDLHVGFEIHRGTGGEETSLTSKGFYFRRQSIIEKFLDKLGGLSDDELCDLVYDSIAARLRYMSERNQKDPFLDRDLNQVRTLSMIAAGCGAKLLAALCRTLFFDYRHYSGGLPDLLMVRGVYDGSGSQSDKPLVDLGSWVGEAFSQPAQESLAAQRAVAILADREDEFLGCSKVGDSGGSSQLGRRSQSKTTKEAKTKIPSIDMLPERLRLRHNGSKVRVECMMVEVKSSNDRLDARQEDWLNILDRHGNARVCKFENNSKAKRKKETKKNQSATASGLTSVNKI